MSTRIAFLTIAWLISLCGSAQSKDLLLSFDVSKISVIGSGVRSMSRDIFGISTVTSKVNGKSNKLSFQLRATEAVKWSEHPYSANGIIKGDIILVDSNPEQKISFDSIKFATTGDKLRSGFKPLTGEGFLNTDEVKSDFFKGFNFISVKTTSPKTIDVMLTSR
ncbi:hypothetical protein J2857_002863 [Neorhizobium galegae]|uniref:hypothetical protein n=1 Tax=Neorhizobium galegae TaxID=399 RepID=UPI001AE2E813|nr:hypothetical protein [Neorhizobium galegae]MBP2560094.1 hypothetical protein [Neorhizobium galegae]